MNLIRASSSAVAACALALAAVAPVPAHAATATYTDPVCGSFYVVPNTATGAGPGDVLLRCLMMNCAITPTPAAVNPIGQVVTLTATCNPAAPLPTTFVWSLGPRGNTGCPAPLPGTSANNVILSPSGLPPNGGTCFYEVVIDDTGGNKAQLRTMIVWSNARPACTPVATPSSLATGGGTTTITSICTPPVTDYTWQKTPPGGNPSLYSNVANPGPDLLIANTSATAAVYRYSLQACNGVNNCTDFLNTFVNVTVAAAVAPPSNCSVAVDPGTSITAAGGAIMLTGSCAGGGPATSWAWTRSPATGFVPQVSGVQTDTLPANPSQTQTVQYSYTATASNGGGTAQAVQVIVTVGAAATAPSNCSIGVSPTASLGSAGGAVTLTGSCTGGGAPTVYSWSRSPSAGFTATSGNPINDNLPANTGSSAVTYTYTLTAGNGGGSATPAQTNVSVAGQASGTQCSGYSKTINLTMPWTGLPTNSGQAFRMLATGFGPTDAIVVQFTTGSIQSTNTGHFSGAESGTQPSHRDAILSASACDFTTGLVPNTANQLDTATFNSVFCVNANPSACVGGFYPSLLPNTTYYLNIRNTPPNPACSAQGSCDMVIDLTNTGLH